MLMSDAYKRRLHRTHAVLILALIGLAAAGCQPAASVSQPVASPGTVETAKPRPAFVGSASCRDCHEQFHELWAGSRHGLAMQPYTADFARRELSAQKTPVSIGQRAFAPRWARRTGSCARRVPPERRRIPSSMFWAARTRTIS